MPLFNREKFPSHVAHPRNGESVPLTKETSPRPYQTIDTLSQANQIRSQPVDQTPIKKPSRYSVFKGLFLAFLSGVFYSSATVIVKYMENLHPGQLSLYRFIALFAMSLPQTVQCGENPFGPRNKRSLLVLGGIFEATNNFLNFLAFRYLPLGEAAVIIFSVPVFVTIAARVFLNEPCGIFQALTVVMTIIGIVFTAHLPSSTTGSALVYKQETFYGVLSAVVSLFFSTCRFIAIRKVKIVHYSVIMFNFGWVAIIETGLIMFLAIDFQLHTCGIQSLYIILLGIFSYAGQNLLTIALQCEMTGPVSTVRAATDIVLAFIWQIFFFENIPNAYSIVGAFLVGFSVVFVGFSKWVLSLPDESSYWERLKWVLV